MRHTANTQRFWMLTFALALAWLTAGPVAAQYHDFPDPKGYWSFDRCDGTTTYDAAVTPHHATTHNGASCSTWGRYGSSGWFDGSDDLVEVNGLEMVRPTQVTIAAWVYPKSTSGIRTIANQWYAPDSWALFIENGYFVFSVAFPNDETPWGESYRVTSPLPATPDTWTHVAGSFDGGHLRLYVNGTVTSLFKPGVLQSSTRKIAIGNHPASNAFHGYIDEVKFYDRLLPLYQMKHLATPPSANTIRGIHLMPSPGTCAFNQAGCDPGIVDKFRKDLGRIHSIGNLNSVKTAIFSQLDTVDPSRSFWQERQREKLTYLHSAAGNHVTWIFRASPTLAECSPGSDYFECGRRFAHDLEDVFYHIQNTLKLQHVFIEVANEPNHPDEVVFYDPKPRTNIGRYNDFFRGFYYGERELGYSFPLTYAGLTSGCQDNGVCDADLWYKDYWVRYHIQNYASRVGVHVYWNSTTASAWNGRLTETGGLYYRRVRDILASTSYTPTVSPRGIQMTEFNFNKAVDGHTFTTQAIEFCKWFKQAASDAASGYWVEQSTLFVTSTEDESWKDEYLIDDNQLDDIRDCQ